MKLDRKEFLKLLVSSLPLLYMNSLHLPTAKTQQAKSENAPNFIILLLDTLSAKHISFYGYPRETMPNLAKFAGRSTVYFKHHSTGNYTTPGTASLLTGTYPWTHRAIRLSGTAKKEFADKNIFRLFSDKNYVQTAYTHNLVAHALLLQMKNHIGQLRKPPDLYLDKQRLFADFFESDYSVAGFSRKDIFLREDGHATSLLLSSLIQILRSEKMRLRDEEYDPLFPRGISRHFLSQFLLEDAVDWLKTLFTNIEPPFLGYFHLLPPHAPYRTRQEFVDMFDDGWKPISKPEHFFSGNNSEEKLLKQRRYYDEFIAYTDAELGRLFEFMQREGLFENSWVVVTSDHGEIFERGMISHGGETLHQPLLHIPLLISSPGQITGKEVHATTSSIDVLPTLLHVTGQQIPGWCEGEILPPFREQPQDTDRAIYAVEAKRNPKLGKLNIGTFAIIKGGYKLTYYRGYEGFEGEYELYNLEEDPEEIDNLYSINNPIALELWHQLERKIISLDQPFID